MVSVVHPLQPVAQHSSQDFFLQTHVPRSLFIEKAATIIVVANEGSTSELMIARNPPNQARHWCTFSASPYECMAHF